VLSSGEKPYEHKGVRVYGAGWDEPVPEPASGGFNVLIVHGNIHPDKLYPDDREFKTPRGFLTEAPGYDLIACGDYHGGFVWTGTVKGKKRAIVNPGALMRQTVADVQCWPQVLVVDTDTMDVTEHRIPGVAENPFTEDAQRAAKRSAALDEMLTRLSGTGVCAQSFPEALQAHFKQTKPGPTRLVKSAVLELVEAAQQQLGGQ